MTKMSPRITFGQLGKAIQDRDEAKAMLEQAVVADKKRKEEEYRKSNPLVAMYESKIEKENTLRTYNEFCTMVKKSLLTEALLALYEQSTDELFNTELATRTKRGIITNFIEEQGVDNLLSGFRMKTVFLDEVAGIVEKHYNSIMEKCDASDPNSLHVDSEFKKSFFDDLNTTDIDSLAEVIKSRVTTSVEDFITTNMANKLEIKQIIDDSKNRVDSVKTVKDDEKKASLEEAYRADAQRKIYQVKNGRPKSIFNVMVEQMSTSVMKGENHELKEQFTTKEGKLDLDSIVESCKLLYTFLEMVNSTKMIRTTPGELQEFIESFV